MGPQPEPARGHGYAANARLAADRIYGEGVEAIRRIVSDPRPSPQEAYASVQPFVEEMLALLRARNHAILLSATNATPENYILSHAVNVSILSLHLALGLEPRLRTQLQEGEYEQLLWLGAAALLHDVVRVRGSDLNARTAMLAHDAGQENHLHPIHGAILGHIHDIQTALGPFLQAVAGAMPAGLVAHASESTGSQTPVGFQIIALCDLYEAMTGYRPWRQAVLRTHAILSMTNQHRHILNATVVRTLMAQITLYPPGSFVELSSGEVARVLQVHPKSLTRPVVELWSKDHRGPQNPPQYLDLMEAPAQHISSPRLAGTEMETQPHEAPPPPDSIAPGDEDLLLELQTSRRWG